MSNIITDLSSDDEIIERFDQEIPKVRYWTGKQAEKGIFEKATFCQKKTIQNVSSVYFQDAGTIGNEYQSCENLGIVPWSSKRTCDTWFSLLYSSGQRINAIHFYYWNTFGSIGFAKRGILHVDDDFAVRSIIVFTSHAMLRYRSRMHMDHLSPFETITWMSSQADLLATRYYKKNGRHHLDLICEDGVFRSEIKEDTVERKYIVFRFKTYIPFEGSPGECLNDKDKRACLECLEDVNSFIKRNTY